MCCNASCFANCLRSAEGCDGRLSGNREQKKKTTQKTSDIIKHVKAKCEIIEILAVLQVQIQIGAGVFLCHHML